MVLSQFEGNNLSLAGQDSSEFLAMISLYVTHRNVSPYCHIHLLGSVKTKALCEFESYLSIKWLNT